METRNPRTETGNREPETRNRKPETGKKKLEIRNRKKETGNRKTESGNRGFDTCIPYIPHMYSLTPNLRSVKLPGVYPWDKGTRERAQGPRDRVLVVFGLLCISMSTVWHFGLQRKLVLSDSQHSRLVPNLQCSTRWPRRQQRQPQPPQRRP